VALRIIKLKGGLLSANGITVATSDKVTWIKIRGKGSFQNAPQVKSFTAEMINRGYREFVLDLEECPVMDSTFMGVLTGVALRLHQMGHGGLHVIHLNERNSSLLENLGLDQIFDIQSDLSVYQSAEDLPEEKLPPTASGPEEKKEVARLMYEAHQTLSDVQPENRKKFKDVLDYLRKDIDEEG
jgi:anti-anti-sigma factor